MLAIGFVYLFFFFSGRIFGGVIAVEEIWRLFVFARLHLSWTPDIIILLRFKIREYILSIPHEFKKKREREVKGR